MTNSADPYCTEFRKIILRYIKIGYNINVIRQTACMVVNPITVKLASSNDLVLHYVQRQGISGSTGLGLNLVLSLS